MKSYLVAIFLLIFTSASLTATATPYAPYYKGNHNSMQNPAEAAPAMILKQGVDKLTAFIHNGQSSNQAQAMQYLEQEIAPYFDFAYMTRWAAGPNWRNMNAQQRAAMQAQLSQSFLKILGQKLTTYTNQPIRIFTPRGQTKDEVTVSAWIMQPNSYPTKLDFRFYKSKNGWKIFDVKAAGTSAVVYYRKQFKQMHGMNSQARYY